MAFRRGLDIMLFHAVAFLLAGQYHVAVSAHPTRASSRQCRPSPIVAALWEGAQLGCPVPIDESSGSAPVDWSPWTHPPDCLPAEDSSATKYCVYTNSQHGNKGVSFITTPEIAADSIDILDDAGYTHTRNLATTDNGSGGGGGGGPVVEMIDVPGKGKGVIAKRDISRAEVIMADWASIILDLSFPTSVKRTKGYHLLHVAADQLADPDRVLQLGRTSTTSADIVEDVLRTNAFSFPLAGEKHMALYPDVSRINHACKPNAFIRFTPSSLAVSIVATRDIPAGEEISLSYIPLGQPRQERRAALQRWGFNCTCALCGASKTEVAASDYRREKVETLRGALMDAVERWDGTRAVRLSHEIIGLLRAEDGLDSLVAGQYEVLARLHWKANDFDRATDYARTSIRMLEELRYLEESPTNLEGLLKTFV
ncbi:SET domain-containing protein [Xylariomycetidae sp. FL2044]|nr:SET domain-containing protein [Xylariomycetidae sp. FL2044]